MLKDITIILLEEIPGNLSITEIAICLKQLPNVKAARDIQVWCLAEKQVALSNS
jgi:Co/Zn/Cd efflux system component